MPLGLTGKPLTRNPIRCAKGCGWNRIQGLLKGMVVCVQAALANLPGLTLAIRKSLG